MSFIEVISFDKYNAIVPDVFLNKRQPGSYQQIKKGRNMQKNWGGNQLQMN